ncbi:hypothetical protein [Streptomyces sp. DB-54]
MARKPVTWYIATPADGIIEMSRQIRVLEETDAHLALGTGGRDVLDVIQQQIPQRAARWAADWDADPEGMRERRWNWEQCGGRTCGSGRRAQPAAQATARARRESAAHRWNQRLAGNAVDKVLAASCASPQAVNYARGRAANLAIAAQHQARLDAHVLDRLRGVDLDVPVPAAA